MNEKTKHTPGPWKAGLIKSLLGDYTWQVRGGNGHLVLQVTEGTLPDNHDKALLEGAPDLLEALEKAENLYSTYGLRADSLECGKWICEARAAIAKARGEKGGGM